VIELTLETRAKLVEGGDVEFMDGGSGEETRAGWTRRLSTSDPRARTS
jgi:hypothetical protein